MSRDNCKTTEPERPALTPEAVCGQPAVIDTATLWGQGYVAYKLRGDAGEVDAPKSGDDRLHWLEGFYTARTEHRMAAARRKRLARDRVVQDSQR